MRCTLPLICYKFEGYPASMNKTSLNMCALLICIIGQVLSIDRISIYLMAETRHCVSLSMVFW